jgi:hypothetical protein
MCDYQDGGHPHVFGVAGMPAFEFPEDTEATPEVWLSASILSTMKVWDLAHTLAEHLALDDDKLAEAGRETQLSRRKEAHTRTNGSFYLVPSGSGPFPTTTSDRPQPNKQFTTS